MPNVQALKGKVLVEPIKLDEKTAGGIVLPDSTRERARQAIVLDVRENELGIGIGDEVFFGFFAGTEVEVDGREKILVLLESEILCVRKPSKSKAKRVKTLCAAR